MKEAVKLEWKGGKIEEFFQKRKNLHKEAKLNDRANFGPIKEFSKFGLSVLHFLFLKKE